MWRGRRGDIYRELMPGEIQSYYDECEYPLSRMLPLLDNHPLIDEIIIINNDASSTPEWFTDTDWKTVVTVDYRKNIYVNPAWELGIKIARNDKICLFSDDIWWDTNKGLLETIHPILTEDDSCIGVDNSCYFSSNHSPTILPLKYSCEEDVWLLGYGCMMFLNKKNHIPFPEGMKIHYGDYWIVKQHLDNGKTPRKICDFHIGTNSASTTSLETFNPVKKSDIKIFETVMQNKAWATYYAENVKEPYMINAENLLIAAAIGLPISSLKNFIVSFRKVNQKDRFIILVDQATKDASYGKFLDYCAEIIVCDPSTYNTSPINSRHFFYYDIIKNLPKYKNILISDSRDIIFQSDPFLHCPDYPHIFAFEEDSNCGLAHEGNNRTWMATIYGQERLEQLTTKPILCGGALMGSSDCLVEMLRLMNEEMRKIDPGMFSWIIADQPVLNEICYSELSKHLPLSIKKNGEILGNLCLSLVHDYAYDAVELNIKTKQVKVNRHIPSMVHQYDRNPMLLEMYNNLYTFR